MIVSAFSFGPALLAATQPPVTHASYGMVVMIFLFLGPAFYFIYQARKGREFHIRRIPGIDAIEEGVGRATEMGRPMSFTTGLTAVNAVLYAVLGILVHVARRAATLNTKLIIPQSDYEVLPIVEDRVREAYRAAGRVDLFNPEDIRFLSTSQFAFASGYMGIVHREKVATCFLFGSFAAESLILAEAGQQVGAIQVAGTVNNEQVPFFLTSCDYTLIGEEVYAAGAYLSREPEQVGGLKGQDHGKLGVLSIVLLGLIISSFLSIGRGNYREGEKYNSPFARLLYVKPESSRCLAHFKAGVAYEAERPPAEFVRTTGRPFVDLEEKLAQARTKAAWHAPRLALAMRELHDQVEPALRDARDRQQRTGNNDIKVALSSLVEWLEGVQSAAKGSTDDLAKFVEELKKLDAAADKERLARFKAQHLEGRVKKIVEWADAIRLKDGYEHPDLKALPQDAKDWIAAVSKAANNDVPALRVRADRLAARALAIYEDLIARHAALGRNLAAQGELACGSTLPAVFDGAESVDGNADVLRHDWNFGDGGTEPEKGPAKAEHTFKNAKVGKAYTVRLTVSDRQATASVPLIFDAVEHSLSEDEIKRRGPPTVQGDAQVDYKTVKAGADVQFLLLLPKPAYTADDARKQTRYAVSPPDIVWTVDGQSETPAKPNAIKPRYDRPGQHVIQVTASYWQRGKLKKTEVAASAEETTSAELAAVQGRVKAHLDNLIGDLRRSIKRLRALREPLADAQGLLGSGIVEGAADDPDGKFLGQWQRRTPKPPAEGEEKPDAKPEEAIWARLAETLEKAEAEAVRRKAQIGRFGRKTDADEKTGTEKKKDGSGEEREPPFRVIQSATVYLKIVKVNKHTVEHKVTIANALPKIAPPWAGAPEEDSPPSMQRPQR